jgi:hypothetical protein
MLLLTGGCGPHADPPAERAPTDVVQLPAPASAAPSVAAPPNVQSRPDLPLCCTNFEQIKTLDGKKVALEGKYARTAVFKRPFPDEERDRAADRAAKTVQILSGDTGVMLEVYYRPEGKRPDDELGRFDQKRVRVVGTLRARTPEQMHGDIPMQTMIGPCIVDIESIELIE